jgi:hypothetical protein
MMTEHDAAGETAAAMAIFTAAWPLAGSAWNMSLIMTGRISPTIPQRQSISRINHAGSEHVRVVPSPPTSR